MAFPLIGVIGGVLSWITRGGANTVSNIAQSVSGAITPFTGDKNKTEQNIHTENLGGQEMYKAEWAVPEKKGLFNQFVDGANRLVRPMFTYGIVALFAYACIDPEHFSIIAQSFVIIPESMWYIMWTVVGFWFGGRIVQEAATKKFAPNPNAVAIAQGISQQMDTLRKKRKMLEKNEDGVIELTPEEFQAELKDTSKPMSNAAIMEWNSRRANNQ